MALTPEAIYDAWVPRDSRWSAWAKPVLFATMAPPSAEQMRVFDLAGTPNWGWLPPAATPDAAWILDLPGETGVIAGALMAQRGVQPVPLYNVAPPDSLTRAAVDVAPIARMLGGLADDVLAAAVRPDAPPAFLIDSARMPALGRPSPGEYDNRWMVFPQDFPSARVLLDHGIRRAVVVLPTRGLVEDDLQHVLRRWQDDGLTIQQVGVDEAVPTPLIVQKPSHFRWALHRFLAIMSLRRNAAGGFGAIVPIPSQGGRGYG